MRKKEAIFFCYVSSVCIMLCFVVLYNTVYCIGIGICQVKYPLEMHTHKTLNYRRSDINTTKQATFFHV